MSWNKIETEYKIRYGEYFSTPQPVVRKFIIHTIAEEFPNFPRVRIAAVVDHCFKIYQEPISRRTLVNFLQSSLR